ncbi:MAG: Crp/Fnr family transcriptional regulator [Sphingomonadaceae bacterium]
MAEFEIAEGRVLPAALRDKLLERGRRFHVRRNQVVVSAGEEADDVYLVIDGVLQVSLMSARGRELTFREIGAGALFGEMAAIERQPRSATVTAMTDSTLALIKSAAFLEFLENVPGAGLWLARELSSHLRETTDDLFHLATLPVHARVQCELLRLAHLAGVADDHAEIAAAPTHSAIAARIGTHREAVTRELGSLARLGIIAQRGRQLTVISVDRLAGEVRRSTGDQGA